MLSAGQDFVCIDVFNGDADGICALQQFRLNQPASARLISGVKRDVSLLQNLSDQSRASIQVFDISFDSNVDALKKILGLSNRVIYFDHHAAETRFYHPDLTFHWDDNTQVCTSLLVYRHTGQRYPDWAMVGCFGDSLDNVAADIAAQHQISQDCCLAYRELGQLLNYNAYGDQLDDLIYSPIELARLLRPFNAVSQVIAETQIVETLRAAYQEDKHAAGDLQATWQSEQAQIYVLPDKPWARRISGNFANQLKREYPNSSIAILSHKPAGYQVSIRSAHPELYPAMTFAKSFASGGGRAAAAGINFLPASDYELFSRQFIEYFGQH